MVIFEIIFLILGLLIFFLSIQERKIPKGVLEWAVWIIDVFIILWEVIK